MMKVDDDLSNAAKPISPCALPLPSTTQTIESFLNDRSLRIELSPMVVASVTIDRAALETVSDIFTICSSSTNGEIQLATEKTEKTKTRSLVKMRLNKINGTQCDSVADTHSCLID